MLFRYRNCYYNNCRSLEEGRCRRAEGRLETRLWRFRITSPVRLRLLCTRDADRQIVLKELSCVACFAVLYYIISYPTFRPNTASPWLSSLPHISTILQYPSLMTHHTIHRHNHHHITDIIIENHYTINKHIPTFNITPNESYKREEEAQGREKRSIGQRRSHSRRNTVHVDSRQQHKSRVYTCMLSDEFLKLELKRWRKPKMPKYNWWPGNDCCSWCNV